MANFIVDRDGSFVSGTAASDTFLIGAYRCTVLGLEGDDAFSIVVSLSNFFDLGAGNDSFNVDSNHFQETSLVLGGDGNDWVFIGAGTSNTVLGGAGGDWLGLGGAS